MASIEEFFDIANRGAKLVWCMPGKILEVTQLARAKGFEVLTNYSVLPKTRDMGGHCFIVTDEDLMRGIDYRLQETGEKQGTEDEDGIDLLVTCPFSNTRAYQQGLARVGRYNEPCSRYGLKGKPRVDEQQVRQLEAKLSRCKV